ncbi:MAG: hypothetical protein L0220_24195, partial [Acidobacteria bacterium]|nr:hypothetical protein [Acidobacteriota bacterium]
MTSAFAWQDLAAVWGYYLFHAFWQASLTAVIVMAIVKACKFLPSNVRYGVLMVALLKFAFPLMPPLPV